MVKDEELLPGNKVQEIAEKFLLARCKGPKITFAETKLVIKKETGPIYEINGMLTMPLDSFLHRFTYGSPSHRFSFKVEVDAKQGTILHYELN